MEVKIYREPENENLILSEDELNEYNRLISKLNYKNEQENKVPSVYIALNDSMIKLLKALVPQYDEIKNYNKSTIPLEVLKVVEYAEDNKMFEGYEVWYADKNPDPILIGWNYSTDEAREKQYSWMKNYSIIARWGDCAMELNDLLKKGFQSLKTSLIDSAKEVESYSAMILKDPDSFVRKHLKNNFNPPKIDINGTSDLGLLPF